MKVFKILIASILLLECCYPQSDNQLICKYKANFERLYDAETRFDSMSFYLDEIIYLSLKSNKTSDYLYGLVRSTNISYIQEDYELMGCLAWQSLNESIFAKDSFNLSAIYNNLGTYYAMINNIQEAIYYTILAVEEQQNEINSSEGYIDMLISLENLGILYGYQGDLDKAASYYNRVISLANDSLGRENNAFFLQSIISCNYNLALDYYSRKNFESARIFYEKNLDFFENDIVPNKKLRIYTLISVANTYRELNLFEKSKESLKLARVYQNEYLRDHGFIPRNRNYHNVSALYYADIDSFTKAIEFSTKAIQICFDSHPSINGNNRCGDLNSILGEIYELKGEIRNSLKYNHRALSYYSQTNKYHELYNEIIPNTEFNEVSPELLKIVINKIHSLIQLYEWDNRITNLELARSHTELLFQLVERLREQLQTLSAQLFISNELRPSFEQAIEISLKLHGLTGEQKYLYEAFSLAEKGKAVLLANALNDTYAKYSGGVPDSLLAEERELKANITFYKNQIFKEENKIERIDSLKIDSWERKVFELEREQEGFYKMLAQNYPDYHDYLNQEETINVTDIQRNLDPNTCLIEFFAGDSSLYIFFLDKDGLSYKEITSPNEIYKEIDEFSTSFREEDSKPQSISEFKKSAFFLFDEILAEKISSYSKLIFIPDGQLGKIPFEFLLTKKDDTSSFRELSYLGNTYDIQYGYSAKMLYNAPLKRRRQKAKKLWAGFAPHFEGEKRLVFNSQEVEGINQLMQGDVFINSKANLKEAKAIIDQYKILHFATHGYSQMERPMYSRIEFTYQDSLEDGVFYAHDLMNHKINADLVVLSACETGEGKVAKGEGIMSFAWAFRYAGAPSILMSLWKAESSVSQRIMLSFYKYLKEGKSKTEALRLAKQDYIQNPIPGREHPKYWANFILIGDDAPIFIDPKLKWIALSGLILFMVLVIMAIYQRRRSVQAKA